MFQYHQKDHLSRSKAEFQVFFSLFSRHVLPWRVERSLPEYIRDLP